MKKLEHSKWTAVNKIRNWRHYEVLNINKKKQFVEMFAVCAKKLELKFLLKISRIKINGKVVGMKL